LRRLEIDEDRDIAKYGKQLKALGDEPSIAILKEVIADEREHYQTLGNLIRSRRPLPAMSPEQAQEELDSLLNARKEGHPQAAGWVGDAIYGVNDGLGSIFGIVSGVSGATLGNSHSVLIAGLAGMVASALSMGSGAYLVAKSEREIFEAEFAREREAVEDNEAEARPRVDATARDAAGARDSEPTGVCSTRGIYRCPRHGCWRQLAGTAGRMHTTGGPAGHA
jgi:vacuolar iron transporter family protein